MGSEVYAVSLQDGSHPTYPDQRHAQRRETFLTSLALALELSDQVQRAVGAVNLDSCS